MELLKERWRGLALCLAIAVPAAYLGNRFPIIGGPVIAIIAGMIMTQILKDKTKMQPGITFTSKDTAVRRHFVGIRPESVGHLSDGKAVAAHHHFDDHGITDDSLSVVPPDKNSVEDLHTHRCGFFYLRRFRYRGVCAGDRCG